MNWVRTGQIQDAIIEISFQLIFTCSDAAFIRRREYANKIIYSKTVFGKQNASNLYEKIKRTPKARAQRCVSTTKSCERK